MTSNGFDFAVTAGQRFLHWRCDMIRKRYVQVAAAFVLVTAVAAPCSAQGYRYSYPYPGPSSRYYVPGNYFGLPPVNFSSLSLLPSDPTMSGYGGFRPSVAVIRVRVPADAKVWFDGDPTSQGGTDRAYTTPDL